METRTWAFIDKSEWLRGPWDSEPDKKQWTDPTTGLPCMIRRGPPGALCGYVGVPEGHPAFARSCSKVDNIEVHWGLTYSDFCEAGEPEHGICHIPSPGEPDRVWWFGFDCAHAGDLTPAPMYCFASRSNEAYRDFGYVTAECTRLAAQLSAMRGPKGLPSAVVDRTAALHEIAEALVSKVGANAAPASHWIETIEAVEVAARKAGYVIARPINLDLVARIDAYLATVPAGRTLYEGHPDVLLAEAREALCAPISNPETEATNE